MRSTGSPPQKFVGRKEELKELKLALEHTKTGMAEHTIMFGSFGIGKTSLLIEFKNRIKDAFAVRIPMYATGDITEICDIILRESRAQLGLKPKKLREHLTHFGFTLLGTGASITLGQVQMNPQSALKGVVHSIYAQLPKNATLVLLVDDLHRITGEKGIEAKKILSILSNILLMLNQEGNKIMFVGTGSHDIFRIIREHDESSVRVFHPHEIPPLTLDEVKEAVFTPASEEGILFSDKIIKEIYEMSEGNPYYIQILAYYCFEEESNNKVEKENFERGFIRALNDLAEKEFRGMYEKTSDGAKRILAGMVESKKRFLKHNEIRKFTGKETSPTPYLNELVEKNVIIKEGRGTYRVRDKLFTEYLYTHKPYTRNGALLK